MWELVLDSSFAPPPTFKATSCKVLRTARNISHLLDPRFSSLEGGLIYVSCFGKIWVHSKRERFKQPRESFSSSRFQVSKAFLGFHGY